MNNFININRFNDLKAVEETPKIKSIEEWADDWYKSILPEENRLSLMFDKWDNEFKGKLRSKLVPVIGYGGTKKSLLAHNIAKHNAVNSLGRILYSSMEMGAVSIINRTIDMIVEPNSFNSSLELEYYNNLGKLDAKDFYINNFAKYLKDVFFVTENTAMTSEIYDKLFTYFKNNGKQIDILVVDGLAGMGGKGTETELYSRHAKELKQLANKWHCLILLICHVSKGGKKTDRDLSSFIRSSEKIIDECDFYISSSLYPGRNKDEFNYKYGNHRLVNKRGTGNIIDVVYEFDEKRLLMKESDYKHEDLESFNEF